MCFKSILKYNINYESGFKKLEVTFKIKDYEEIHKCLIEYDTMLQCYNQFYIYNKERQFVDCVSTKEVKEIMLNIVNNDNLIVTALTCI